MEKNEIVLLNQEDQRILDEFRESGFPKLAPQAAASFFELYLNGTSPREIQKLNPAFKLGAILDAQIRYNWDANKDRYVQELQENTVKRLAQVQMEATAFLADSLAAAHKKHGTALRKYLQTSDESELNGFDIGSITSYSRSIDALLKITGQDQKKIKLESKIEQNVNLKNMGNKPLTPEQAAALLEILEDKSE
jgi:hypothetical protein